MQSKVTLQAKKVYVQPEVDVSTFRPTNIIATSGHAYFDPVDFITEEE